MQTGRPKHAAYKRMEQYVYTAKNKRRLEGCWKEGFEAAIVGPANQTGCIIRCVGNLADEKL
jgi:hypothetical protein